MRMQEEQECAEGGKMKRKGKKKKKDEEEYFSGHIFQVSTVIWVDYIIYSAPFYSPTYLPTDRGSTGRAGTQE